MTERRSGTLIAIALAGAVLGACTGPSPGPLSGTWSVDRYDDPGPLGGTWQVSGPHPVRVSFAHGVTETMGAIDHVSYEVQGRDVLMVYEDGPAAGRVVQITMTGPHTAKAEFGTLTRIVEQRGW